MAEEARILQRIKKCGTCYYMWLIIFTIFFVYLVLNFVVTADGSVLIVAELLGACFVLPGLLFCWFGLQGDCLKTNLNNPQPNNICQIGTISPRNARVPQRQNFYVDYRRHPRLFNNPAIGADSSSIVGIGLNSTNSPTPLTTTHTPVTPLTLTEVNAYYSSRHHINILDPRLLPDHPIPDSLVEEQLPSYGAATSSLTHLSLSADPDEASPPSYDEVVLPNLLQN